MKLYELLSEIPSNERSKLITSISPTMDDKASVETLVEFLAQLETISEMARDLNDTDKAELNHIIQNGGVLKSKRLTGSQKKLIAKHFLFPIPYNEPERYIVPDEFIFFLLPEPVYNRYSRYDRQTFHILQCLRKYDLNLLKRVIEELGLSSNGGKAQLASAIKNHLVDDKNFLKYLRELPAVNQQIFETIYVWEGYGEYNDLCNRFKWPPVLDYELGDVEAEKFFPRHPLNPLLTRGLLYNFGFARYSIFVIPIELSELYKEHVQETKRNRLALALKKALETVVEVHSRQSCPHDIVMLSKGFTLYAQELNLKLTQKKNFYKVPLKKIAEKMNLRDEAVFDFLIQLHIPLASATELWWTDYQNKINHLDNGYSRAIEQFFLQLWHSDVNYDSQENYISSDTKKAILIMLLLFSRGTAIPLSNLRLVFQSIETMIRFGLGEELPSIACLDPALPNPRHVTTLQENINFQVFDELYYLGIIDFGYNKEGRVTHIFLSDKGREILKRKQIVKSDECEDWKLRALPTMEIMVDLSIPLSDLLYMGKYCVITSLDRVAVFRMDAKSLGKAVNDGLSVAEIAKFMESHTAHPLPDTIQQLLKDTGAKEGEIELTPSGGYLTVSEAHLLEEIKQIKEISECIADKPSQPTAFLKPGVSLERIRKELQKRGYFIKVEKGSAIRIVLIIIAVLVIAVSGLVYYRQQQLIRTVETYKEQRDTLLEQLNTHSAYREKQEAIGSILEGIIKPSQVDIVLNHISFHRGQGRIDGISNMMSATGDYISALEELPTLRNVRLGDQKRVGNQKPYMFRFFFEVLAYVENEESYISEPIENPNPLIRMQKMEAELNSLIENVDKQLGTSPEPPPDGQYALRMAMFAEKHGLNIVETIEGEMLKQDIWRRHKLSINCEGETEDMVKFFDAIATSDYLLFVEEFDLASLQTPHHWQLKLDLAFIDWVR